MPDIRITVDGRPALTTAQAAQRHARTSAEMRTLFSVRRYNLEPVAALDDRTPLYDLEAVDALIGGMVGQGKGGGRKPTDGGSPTGKRSDHSGNGAR